MKNLQRDDDERQEREIIMAPRQQEESPLLGKGREDIRKMELSSGQESSTFIGDVDAAVIDETPSKSKSSSLSSSSSLWTRGKAAAILLLVVLAAYAGRRAHRYYAEKKKKASPLLVPTGPYRLAEAHEGYDFFSHYDFYDGPDSLGSAGHNVYVSKTRAMDELDIAGIVVGDGEEEFVYMSSSAAAVPSSSTEDDGRRESVRLEGKTRFERGLFILDVRHMPDGCGVWPAFWMTDEDEWPNNGEVDVLEGVNGQTTAKTALHTSDHCDMYAHVAPYAKTGYWERITGIPETFTGIPDFETSTPADNCWVMAPHQWANEGCTAVHDRDDTIGKPVNDNGGGVYVLEWDPTNGYIKSWVFSPDVPLNLRDAIDTAAGTGDQEERVMPDPSLWGLPYAYFAIGEGTGCSADHFKNMRIVFNLAFCGNVAGNRFSRECPTLAEEFNVTNDAGYHDPVLTCNAYIESNPEALEEAYWKIKGVYVYERELEEKKMVPE